MRVVELWRYPVKSIGGERLAVADVGELGVEGDRGWGIYDLETGNVLTARRVPELLFASSRISSGEVVMILPDGTSLGADNADAPLTTWLERPVELRRAGDEGGTFEAPMDVDNDADWVSWTGPAGAFHDSKWSRVSLVSSGSLGEWDIRRFRTNVVVDGAGEDHFVGDHLRFGDERAGVESGGAELAVFKRIDRCVMVSRPQPGLERDLALLKQINHERERCLSIGALVASPGAIAVGDTVTHLAKS